MAQKWKIPNHDASILPYKTVEETRMAFIDFGKQETAYYHLKHLRSERSSASLFLPSFVILTDMNIDMARLAWDFSLSVYVVFFTRKLYT